MKNKADIAVYTAKRALAGCGNYEMTADGELISLDLGRDGVRHVPRGCKKITNSIFHRKLDEKTITAEIRFCEVACIDIGYGVTFTSAPYTANKISKVTIDLSNGKEIVGDFCPSFCAAFFLIQELFDRLKNVKIEFIFGNKFFAKKVSEIYFYFGFDKYRGLHFAENNGKLVVFAGVTDITEQFCNADILEHILDETPYKYAEELMQKLNDFIKETGIEISGDFLLVTKPKIRGDIGNKHYNYCKIKGGVK